MFLKPDLTRSRSRSLWNLSKKLGSLRSIFALRPPRWGRIGPTRAYNAQRAPLGRVNQGGGVTPAPYQLIWNILFSAWQKTKN